MARVRSHDNLSVVESFKKYYKQVERSEGFDVDYFPALRRYMGLVSPVPNDPFFLTQLTKQAKSAIEHFNEQNGTAYEVVEVLKATNAVIRSAHHRITFVAKQKGEEDPKTFQAHLSLFMRDIHYEFVRLKPPPLAHQTSKVPNKRKLMLTSTSRGWRLRVQIRQTIRGNKKGCKSRSGKKLSPFESYKKYLQQVKESESFDVDKFPALEGFIGLVQPFPDNPSEQEHVNHCAEKAIEHYNKQNNTTYEFVKVLKSTIKEVVRSAQPFVTFDASTIKKAVCGAQHFITFDAKKKDAADTETFQANVISSPQTLDFKFVRLISPQNKQGNYLHCAYPRLQICSRLNAN